MRFFNYENLARSKWDSEIINLLSQIHEHKGKQELFLTRKPAVLDKLVEIAKIQSVEDSNRIEGIVTTAVRIKELMNQKTTPRNRDEEEILGYRDVLNMIHESYEYIPISSNYILQLHRDLFKYSEKGIGGRYKNTQNSIVEKDKEGNSIERFKPLSPYETPSAIEQICNELNIAFDKKDVDSLLLIPIFIHDFLCIHPFNDGNGRMSRLLTTLLLYRQGYVIGKYISLESIIEKNKDSIKVNIKYFSPDTILGNILYIRDEEGNELKQVKSKTKGYDWDITISSKDPTIRAIVKTKNGKGAKYYYETIK